MANVFITTVSFWLCHYERLDWIPILPRHQFNHWYQVQEFFGYCRIFWRSQSDSGRCIDDVLFSSFTDDTYREGGTSTLGAVRAGSPEGAGHWKNFVDHVFKYAVFDIKLAYNQYFFKITDVQSHSPKFHLERLEGETSDCGGTAPGQIFVWPTRQTCQNGYIIILPMFFFYILYVCYTTVSSGISEC